MLPSQHGFPARVEVPNYSNAETMPASLNLSTFLGASTVKRLSAESKAFSQAGKRLSTLGEACLAPQHPGQSGPHKLAQCRLPPSSHFLSPEQNIIRYVNRHLHEQSINMLCTAASRLFRNHFPIAPNIDRRAMLSRCLARHLGSAPQSAAHCGSKFVAGCDPLFCFHDDFSINRSASAELSYIA